jgi:hypothetical protein
MLGPTTGLTSFAKVEHEARVTHDGAPEPRSAQLGRTKMLLDLSQQKH